MKSKHDINGQTCTCKESATYRIRIQGALDEQWSDCLGGMSISTNRGEEHEVVTTLIGQLCDQAALVGVINTLYDMRLPILQVECLSKDATVLPS